MATARCCSYACSSALASSSRRPFSTTPFPTSAFHRPTAKAAAAAKATATSPIQPTPLSAVRTARLAAAAAAAAAAGTSDVARATGSEDAGGPSPSELVGPRLIFDQPRHITYPQNQVQSTRMSLANDQGSVLRRTSLKGAFSNATFRVSVARKEFLPPKGSAPEIIFAGRSNVGKSSLINALVCSDSLVKTSSKAGHTKMLNFFDVGGRMVLVDAPGYGDRGRPEWGALFSYYVTQHPPSPPSLLVVLYPLDHKLLPSDQIFLASLPSHLHVLPVFTKSDVVDPRQINAKRSTLDRAIQAARESAWTEEDELGAKGRLLPSVCVSTQRKFPLRDETLENLREVILDHLTSTASSHAPAPRSREPVAEAPTRAQTPRQGGRKAPAPTARSKKTPNMKRR